MNQLKRKESLCIKLDKLEVYFIKLENAHQTRLSSKRRREDEPPADPPAEGDDKKEEGGDDKKEDDKAPELMAGFVSEAKAPPASACNDLI